MTGLRTPYAELGLPFDADRGEVDRAYRALMKLHHPDVGGDAARAAAINRAYAELTRPVATSAEPRATPDLARAIFERRVAGRRPSSATRRTHRRWLWLPLVVLAGFGLWLEQDSLAQLLLEARWRYFPTLTLDAGSSGEGSKGAQPADASDSPIRLATVINAVHEATALLAKGGVDAASDASRQCYQRLASEPSFAWLDSCLAFDDAVMRLTRSSATEQHAFGAVALTARQLAAGRALGADYGTIEDRLDQVRLLTLRIIDPPSAPPPLAPAPVENPSRL